MNEEPQIITIRKVDITKANECFAELMSKTERIFNQHAKESVDEYKKLSGQKLETKSVSIIQEACKDTPFENAVIDLKSDRFFPDIVAGKYYGIEVKSTEKNHWTSTGSSIVESTRVEDVDNIYMLFGKLGGTPAEFRCRPYQDVLRDIAVTHSPRYLIDMDLKPGQTIFDKIGTSYDVFRKSNDSIDCVKKYYKQVAKDRGNQMPWWIGDSDTEPVSMNMRLWSDASSREHAELRAQMLILFPEMVNSKYGNAAMWLAGARGIIDPSFRDRYSAGGKVYIVDGKPEDELPRVWKTLSESFNDVKKCLASASLIMPYIIEYNPDLLNSGDIYEEWMKQIERMLPSQTINGTTYNIREALEKGKRFKVAEKKK